MMSSSTSAKRERHPTLYFPDGDIILCAWRTSKPEGFEQLFRVHRFLLTHHSPVFATMFTLPLPGAAQQQGDEVYEGAPVVQMADRAEDLTGLLTLLYNPS